MPSEPKSIISLRAYAKLRLTDDNIDELAQAFLGESDRTVVVVLASILEDVLANQIRQRLRPMSADEEKALRLFSFDGPFGTFSTLINVGYALEIIDENTRAELHDLREMRNACAHSPRPISFATPELANVCKRLFSEERESLIGAVSDDPVDLRCAFEFKFVATLLTILHSKQRAHEWLAEANEERERKLPTSPGK